MNFCFASRFRGGTGIINKKQTFKTGSSRNQTGTNKQSTLGNDEQISYLHPADTRKLILLFHRKAGREEGGGMFKI